MYNNLSRHVYYTSSSSEACQEFTTTSTSLNFEPSTTNKILCYSSLVYCCLLVLNHFVFCYLQLVSMLTTYKVDAEKEVYNITVSKKVLESLTPQEIRDLRVVFDAFDVNSDGYVSQKSHYPKLLCKAPGYVCITHPINDFSAP